MIWTGSAKMRAPGLDFREMCDIAPRFPWHHFVALQVSSSNYFRLLFGPHLPFIGR
jgi:hypothetical protein